MIPSSVRLKDIYFSNHFLQQVAEAIQARDPEFDAEKFLACARGGGFDGLALKAKMRHVTTCLYAYLPDEYESALRILLDVAPEFTDFDGMVFSDYVACYGLHDWERSLSALRELTKAVSAEFAVRPFLRHDPQRALPYLTLWSDDPDPAVRRLASEGSRPRLPWGVSLPAFKKNPRPLFPILEKLRHDPSEDVRRSVANHLNDIAKDNPALVLQIASEWLGESLEVDRLVKHACRTLLKAGNLEAMRLFGFDHPHDIHISDLLLDPARLKIGEDLVISYMLKVETAEAVLLRLEVAVHYVRANGRTSRKIFHHREGEFAPGSHTISKKHSFRNLSTRKHYPGRHRVDIIVNGVTLARSEIMLTN